MGIDIFLSSASRQGYSQDMVDLFAKPTGAFHQYRYASKWIAEEVIGRISSGEYAKKPQVMLCFIDQGTKNITPVLLPVRFATIEGVREHGTTRSIQFRLGGFCKVADVGKFNEIMRSRFKAMPEYVGGNIQGKYWLYDDAGVKYAI